MKKIAIALVATATLALAACGDNATTNNTSNVSEALNEAETDLGNALEATENAAGNVADAAENLTDAAGAVAENASDAAANATR